MIKSKVAQRFLEFVGRRLPLIQASLASLGGEGMEATLWSEAGVPADHGWLVERDAVLRRCLQEDHPFHLCTDLSKLPVAMARSDKDEAPSLDGLHLDLCGTLDPAMDEVRPVIPLVTRSRGRCLAITVADERRNRVLEEFDSISIQARRLLGSRQVESYILQLARELGSLPEPREARPHFFQPADPVKCAKREFGTMMGVLTLLCSGPGQLVAVPDEVERFVYVSDFRRYHWRMRTYFIHMAKPRLLHKKEAARQLFANWMRGALYYIQEDESFVHIAGGGSVRPTLGEREITMPSPAQPVTDFAKLRQIAETCGGDVLVDFQEMERLARSAQKLEETLSSVRAAMNGAMSPEEEATGVVQTMEPRRRSPRPTAATSEDSKKLQVQMNLVAVKAKIAGGADESIMDDAVRQGARDLGLVGDRGRLSKKARKSITSHYAHTQGSFRRHFIRRVRETLGDAVLNKLAESYSKLDGRQVTPATLIAESST